MKKKFKTSKKSMRVLITILISLVCINGALMVATIISSATVTPAASMEDATANFAATKASELQIANFEAKLATATTDTAVAATTQPKVAVKAVSTSKTTVKKTTTKATATTTPKATTTTTTKATTTTTTKATTTTTTAPTTTTTSTATSSTSGVSTLKNSVTGALINAFDQLEFKIVVNPNATYLGYFSTSKHSLEMRSISVSTFRHEMGHFLDVLKNMPSRSSEFAGIYAREKGKYTGTNATYITKNAQEYFAQSYRNYLENATKLKTERPETYAFVKAQISSITSTDINRTYNMYSWSW